MHRWLGCVKFTSLASGVQYAGDVIRNRRGRVSLTVWDHLLNLALNC